MENPNPQAKEKDNVDLHESIESWRKQRMATRTTCRQTFEEIQALTIKPSTSKGTLGNHDETDANFQHHSKKSSQTEQWKVNLNSGKHADSMALLAGKINYSFGQNELQIIDQPAAFTRVSTTCC